MENKKIELNDEELDQVAGGANEGDIQVFYCARDCKCSREFKCDANGKWVCVPAHNLCEKSALSPL